MAECKDCKRTDIKCCPTCARNGYTCNVWHKCEEDCEGYEPRIMTNAQKIRNMTDEELAEFLEKFEVCTFCVYNDGVRCTFDKPCVHDFAIATALEWLKSEVKE